MIKVFIIDDAMLMRNIVKKIIKNIDGIEVIGEAANPIDAMEEFKKVGFPDVFILDLEMPKMDGLTFLKQLKEQRPIPTVVFASMVSDKSTKAIEAMELGACDIIVKPARMQNGEMKSLEDEFKVKVKAAAASKSINNVIVRKKSSSTHATNTNHVIAFGASTGGVQTLEFILTHLDGDHPPIVITQHMPENFTASFAKRLNKICKESEVCEAKDEQILENGNIYIAPGNIHLEVKRTGIGQYSTALKDYPKVSNHKPSVDVLFRSISNEVKDNAVAFILTGMGKDGAQGIKKIRESGGQTFAQDEQSSIVYGMPRVAYEIGGIDKKVTLNEIIDIINGMKRG